jgi:FG-GAP repeat
MITFHWDTHASFLTDELDLWYHGGLEDMGTNVAWKWQQLTEMFKTENEAYNFTKGPQKAPSCSVFGQGFLRDKLSFYAELMGVRFTENDGHHEYTYDDKTFKSNSLRLMNELFNDLNIHPMKYESENTFGEAQVMSQERNVNSSHELSYFGKSMAFGDFDGDGIEEVFVGAPGYSIQAFGQVGALYKLSMNATDNITNELLGEPYLLGPDPYSRFGYSVVKIDINRDGIDDLVVSAPAHGKSNVTDIGDYYAKDYNGRLYVYLGQKGVGLSKTPAFEVRSNRAEDDFFFNMGQNLRVSDCDKDGHDDLIVLSPLS